MEGTTCTLPSYEYSDTTSVQDSTLLHGDTYLAVCFSITHNNWIAFDLQMYGYLVAIVARAKKGRDKATIS